MMAACRVVVWAALMVLMLFCSTPSYAHFGSCEDHSPQCPGWAAGGHCHTNIQFMLSNCPVSCDSCIDPGCFDRSPYCSWGVRLGLCRTNRQHMLSVCRHSCNACRVKEAAVRRVFRGNIKTIAKPDFQCGKAPGTSSRRARQIIFPDELEKMKGNAVNQRQALNKSTTIVMLPGDPSMLTPVNRNIIRVNDTFCGATPISDRFLLTAAHCVFNPDFPVRTVRLGELDFSSDSEENSKPVDYEVEQIIVHPDFNPESRVRYNDVALLRTVQKIEFNEFVFPYCLSRERPKPKTLVTGAGFGLVFSQIFTPKFWKSLRTDGLLLTYQRGHKAVFNTHSVGGNSERTKFIGMDQYGNKYYEDFTPLYKNQRRWVEFNDYLSVRSPNGDMIPPKWHGWLSHQYDDVPTP